MARSLARSMPACRAFSIFSSRWFKMSDRVVAELPTERHHATAAGLSFSVGSIVSMSTTVWKWTTVLLHLVTTVWKRTTVLLHLVMTVWKRTTVLLHLVMSLKVNDRFIAPSGSLFAPSDNSLKVNDRLLHLVAVLLHLVTTVWQWATVLQHLADSGVDYTVDYTVTKWTRYPNFVRKVQQE